MKSKKTVSQSKSIKNATVLVTGGTGSFGNAVIDRLLKGGCKEIRIFSRDEKKQHDMRLAYENLPLRFYVGDVRDRHSVDMAMEGVDLVFHAAALKQVPTAEFFPMQAVQTNVLGSVNVIESAIDMGVRNVVCLSTDKAVMPVNAMGMTKALMEKAVQSTVRVRSTISTVLCCVRYGNVMYSRGSVIPLFIEQIKRGEPITITDKNMTRFMLPLSDAVELVMFALQEGKSGDIFIKKSAACTVDQLARALMTIFGKKVPIKNIGIRFGEKIDETLASAEEMRRSIDFGDFLRIPLNTTELKYEKFFSEGDKQLDGYTSKNTSQLSDQDLERLLLSLPELSAEKSAHEDAA